MSSYPLPSALDTAIWGGNCVLFPLRLLSGVRSRGTAGIRGRCGQRKADGSVDSRRAAALLLRLVTDWGRAEGAGGRDEGDQSVTEEDSGARAPQDAQTPGALLRSLLQAIQRPSRSPAFLIQPQRFGRNTRGSWSNAGLSSPFRSLAAPQRFGKK
ncbi:pro-FMRFamide-related neuropeptide FF [Balaenoptera acutorostrata]|uniref:Pro-FMRFamide-related neuropeptide FF n=1 Tax=Balaenoptera acutorostrata TaxID=9767 RepID=A0A383ZWN5_BALAC|nr:pro-FMRFamide-related neuropeptide FF [Balaenoptera acutorostrata]